jgi:hypothetical protein
MANCPGNWLMFNPNAPGDISAYMGRPGCSTTFGGYCHDPLKDPSTWCYLSTQCHPPTIILTLQ